MSTEVELFLIRCGINQAIESQNIKNQCYNCIRHSLNLKVKICRVGLDMYKV